MSENNDVGSAWGEKRKRIGKSIDEVSVSLRIAPRYLQGIEECNFDGWPEKVFSTGFIRTYAKYLSVDPAPVLDAYDRTLKKPLQQQEVDVVRPEWMERGNRKTSYVFITGAVLVIGVVLALLTMRGTETPELVPQMPQTDNAALITSSDNAAASEPKSTAAADNIVASKDARKVSDAAKTAPAAAPPLPTTTSPAAPPPATTPPPATPPAATTPPPATPPAGGRYGSLSGPFELILEASDHTWLTYSFDGGDLIEVTLQTDDKISIQAGRTITLRLGNAGGVVGTLNGQRLPPFGDSGRVRTVTFGK